MQIGVILPDSRDMYYDLLSLARDEINSYMETNGHNYRFQFTITDAERSSEKNLNKIKELENQGINLVIGAFWDSMAMKSLDYVNENNILLLSPGSNNPDLSIPDDNLYRIQPPLDTQAQANAQILNRWGIKTLNVLQQDLGGFDEITSSLIERFTDMDGIVAETIVYEHDMSDSSLKIAELEQAADEAAELYRKENTAIQLIGVSDIPVLLQEISQHPTLPTITWFSTSYTAYDHSIIQTAPEEASEIKLISPTPAVSNSQDLEETKTAIQDMGILLNYERACLYDACWLYSLSIAEANTTNIDKLKTVILDAGSNHEGLTGTIQLNENGDRLHSCYQVMSYQYSGGKGGMNNEAYIYQNRSMKLYTDLPEATWVTCPPKQAEIPHRNLQNITGTISPTLDTEIKITYITPTGSTIEHNIQTRNGGFTDTIIPEEIGQWRVKASWEGDETHLGSVSSINGFQVTKKPSEITASATRQEIQLRETLNITGKLDPETSTEIEIQIQHNEDSESHTAETDQHGYYAYIFSPDKPGQYRIKATWNGNETQSKAESSAVNIDVKPLTGSLKASVTDLDGEPLSDVTCQSTSNPEAQQPVNTKTGSSGVIHIEKLATGEYTLEFSKLEHQTQSITVEINEDTETQLTINMEKKQTNVKINIKNMDGEPISGASITMTEYPDEQTPLKEQTDSSGIAEYKDIYVGGYRFNVTKEGFMANSREITAEPETTNELTITLEKQEQGIPGYPALSIPLGLITVYLLIKHNKTLQ